MSTTRRKSVYEQGVSDVRKGLKGEKYGGRGVVLGIERGVDVFCVCFVGRVERLFVRNLCSRLFVQEK